MRKILFFILFMFLSFTNHNLFSKKQNIQKTDVNDIADIYLNFENASLESVVNYLAEQRNINFIPHKDLKTKKVSLTTREPLNLKRAWDVLLTLLEMNGFTIINVDNIYRIVQSKTNKKEPLPLYSSQKGTTPKDLPNNDLVVRYVYVLTNISTETAGKILKDLLGPDKVHTNKELKTCILTDKCLNIKSAMKIIEELDKGGLRESIKIFRLQYTDAKEIADLFNKQILEKKQELKKPIRFIAPEQKKEITFFSNTTKIIPEQRYNALILLGLEKNIDRVIDFVQKYLDVPMEAAESRIHIKELKYVEAPVVKKILDKLVKPPAEKKKTLVEGEFKFFEDVKIQAEKPESGEGADKISKGSGNRLIVSCNKDDWRRLEKIVDKFDKPQPQVALEIMVVDIDDTNDRKLGAQIREKTGKSFSKGLNVLTSHLKEISLKPANEGDPSIEYNNDLMTEPGAAIQTPEPQGTTVSSFGRIGDVWLIIKAFISKSNSNIITQPFVVVSNNEKCEFSTKVTKNVSGKIKAEGNRTHLQFDRIPAETKLTIIPRINVTGLVDLKITINLSEFLFGGEGDTPERSNRIIETRASMATGEVLVLGGLTKDKGTINRARTPILSKIPIIGNLFKSKTKEVKKTNLYVFIRPSIIKPRFEGGPDEYTRLKLDYAKYQIMNVEELRHTKDPIQRWFFKPDRQSIKQKLADLKNNVYRPIDDYAAGKKQPKSVRIRRDPYYRAEEAIKAEINWEKLKEGVKKRAFEIKKRTKLAPLSRRQQEPLSVRPERRPKL